jgi:tetratricopeptide (TPR) repeat protein
MESIRLRAALCIAIALCVLAACSPTSAPPSPSGNLRATPAAGDMVAQVRAAGNTGDSLDVHPLRDPQVEDLRVRASRLESAGDYAGATQAIAQALALTPNDPELLQNAAELALYRKDWTQAEADADKSYQLGPKLGSLCRRNWTTLRFTRTARGDAAGASAAAAKVAACTVEPPVRM